ncbi:MAG: BLUF domain-containing protein [Maricaulaceae bacterium]
MKQIIYVSSAAPYLTQHDLEAILRRSRAWNTDHDITGVLLKIEDGFFQVLEGPEVEVDRIFAEIAKDPRHTGVLPLVQRECTHRQFAAWSMGFKDAAKVTFPELGGFPLSWSGFTDRLLTPDDTTLITLAHTFFTVNDSRNRFSAPQPAQANLIA